jgi:glycosyltransferase involved in cell wall biosynthesis
MLEGSDRVIFPADNIKKYFMSKFPGLRKGKLIRHGIDTKIFRIPDEPVLNDLAIRPRILFVGRFIHRKGLDIMRNLVRDFPECDWVFAGEGVDDPSRWGLANVTNLGPQDRTSLATQYARSDLLVLPSASEAFPLVVQEALACGTTVLIPQDILAGDPAASGVVMTAERSPGGFAAAINAFLCQRRELTSMEARQSRMNFATQRWPIQHCIDEWEKEFRALC